MTLVRYILIQLLAYGIDLGLFVLLVKSGMAGPIVSNIAAKVAAGVFAFVIHRSFTFQGATTASVKRQAILYSLLLAINVPLTSGVLALVLIWLTEPVFAKPLADSICILLTFGLSKFFIFRNAVSRYDQAKPQQETTFL